LKNLKKKIFLKKWQRLILIVNYLEKLHQFTVHLLQIVLLKMMLHKKIN